MTPFGPQLIGRTEKALNALLRAILAPHELSERHWVTLRLTSQFDGAGSVVDAITDRTHFTDTSLLIAELTRRGLLADERLTKSGEHTVSAISSRITQTTGPLWEFLDEDDIAAATRVLNTVLERAQATLRT